MKKSDDIFAPIEEIGEVNHHILVAEFLNKYHCEKRKDEYFIYDTELGIWCQYTVEEIVDCVAIFCNALFPNSWEVRYRNRVREELRLELNKQVRNFKSTDNMVCLANGILCLESGKLKKHSPNYFFTSVLSYEYDPNMECPNFNKFLDDICQSDELRKNTILEFMGCCLTYDIKAQKYAYFYGTGCNGKSTLIRLIEEMVGEEFCTTLEVSELSDKFSKADLIGMKVVTFADISPADSKKVVSAVVKKLTSGDKISTDIKFKSRVRFRPCAKLIFSSNHEISFVEDSSDGAKRRVELIPFLHKVSRKNIDPNLESKLIAELPGIIELARIGYLRLKNNKYMFSNHAESKHMQNMILKKENPELYYVKFRLKKSQGNVLTNTEIKEHLESWCKKNKIRYESISYKKVTSLMQERYPVISKKGTNGIRGWKNIAFK